MSQKDQEAHLFCFPVSHWPKGLILFISSSGVFGAFLLHGVAHENLIKHYHISETFFLTFFQFIGYSLLSLPTLIHIMTKKIKLKAPLYTYVLTSCALACSMGLTNFASVRLSYATGVLFKSSKLIPVMIGNIIFLHKKPKLSEAISVVLIVIGLIGVSLGDFRGRNKFDIPGIIAISLSLVAGAVASNMEDKVMSYYGASQDELISMLYSLGAAIMLTLSIVSGEFWKGLDKVNSDKSSYIFLFFFAVLGSIGIQFVYLTMKVFGSLITVMITSVRKALTVVLSFVIFKDKKFTVWHAVSIILIAAGMSINIYDKTVAKKKEEKIGDQQNLLNDRDDNRVDFEDYVDSDEEL